MMALLFLLLTIEIILAWIGYRRTSFWLFIITLILAVIFFGHHITDHLNLQL